MAGFRHPGVDLRVGHVVGTVKSVPVGDVAQILFPSFVRRLGRRAEAHDVQHGQFVGNAEQRLHGLLRLFLPDRRHPPDIVTKGGGRQMRRHRRGSDTLQQNAFGVLFVHFIEVRPVIEDRKGFDPAEIAGNDNEPRRRGEPAIIRRRKLHFQFRADNLFLAEIFHDPVLQSLIGHDNEVPWLCVRTRRRVTRGVQNQVVMLARHDIGGVERACRDPASDHVHERIVFRAIGEIVFGCWHDLRHGFLRPTMVFESLTQSFHPSLAAAPMEHRYRAFSPFSG